MIRTLLIDDEPDARETLRLLIDTYCPDIEIVGEAASARDGRQLIEDRQPDLVFLDVQMPQQSGFDLLSSLPEVNFSVIFVTAYDQYAIKAIRFGALDYLLKPVDLDDLLEAIRRCHQTEFAVYPKSAYNYLAQNYKGGQSSFKKLAVPIQGETSFIPLDQIIYCEADGSYTHLYQVEGPKLMLSKSLKEMELLVGDHGFFRVHHSYLINLDHIQKYIRGEGGQVVLTANYTIDVSRRKKEEFLRRIGIGK